MKCCSVRAKSEAGELSFPGSASPIAGRGLQPASDPDPNLTAGLSAGRGFATPSEIFCTLGKHQTLRTGLQAMWNE
ncbi:MAG: hypothetical protein DRI57_20345 [Deltaproteobacteria bacterium]|nr:MAG: hypothetical protein DRI57_20345 [Deltaproteobacteria bacterium]